MDGMIVNLDMEQLSRAQSRSGEPEISGRFEERRQNERRTYPVNVVVAPCDAAKAPTEMAFLRVRCHDISTDGISFFLPEPPAFQYMVVAQGTPPHQTYAMAQVVHCHRDPDPTGEYLVGCRLLGNVTIAVIEGNACLSVPPSIPGLDAENEAPEEQPAEQSAPADAAEAAPRTATLETRVEIETMRELAVASARSAIRRHFRRQMIPTAGDNLLITAVGLLAGAAMLWVWKSPDATNLVGYAALASLPVAILWGTRFVIMAWHWNADRSRSAEHRFSGSCGDDA